MNQLVVKVIKEAKSNYRFELMQPYQYMGYTIPVGFKTDFATIPWFVRWFVSPIGKHCHAAVLHDYLWCARITSFDEVHNVFLKAMEESQVNKFKRKMMYLAVKWFSPKWN